MNRNKPLKTHKICDPIHGFIRFDEEEKKVIDSRPFQRLRYIHQMGIAYLIYPGASHKRFEHSLGVMELVSRIYDSITRNDDHGMTLSFEEDFYWRRMVRIAALCHDLGHLPFSHTAEKDLLPEGGHELMTLKIIQSEELRRIWKEFPGIGRNVEEDLIKLVLSEKELALLCPHLKLSEWERILSQSITDHNFGADRVDYLIRDAYYTGVGYGHFDYHQLLDTLRIMPSIQNSHLNIGISASGLQSIESLWIARYLMYARVYHLPKTRVYAKHLARFMKEYFCEMGFPSQTNNYLFWTDYEILSKIAEASENPSKKGHKDALCLMNREKVYQEIPINNLQTIDEKDLISLKNLLENDLFIDKLGEPNKEELRRFSLLTTEGKVVSTTDESQFLRDIPIINRPLTIFVPPSKFDLAMSWVNQLK